MSTVTNKFQSHWGFHPCNRDLFLKLKYLHKRYWQTLYDFHRWHRWVRKEPQNRVGSEPIYCSIFIVNELWYKAARIHGADGFKVYPKSVVDFGIVALYQEARRPRPEPVTPFDIETVTKIESLHATFVAYDGK